MTSHELARKLLAGPDLPVTIPGVGPAEGVLEEVGRIEQRSAWAEPEISGWFLHSAETLDCRETNIIVVEA